MSEIIYEHPLCFLYNRFGQVPELQDLNPDQYDFVQYQKLENSSI